MWRDLVWSMMYQLIEIQNELQMHPVKNRVGDQIQQCAVICDHIQHTLDQKRAKK